MTTHFTIATGLALNIFLTLFQVNVQSVFAIGDYDSDSNINTSSVNPSESDLGNASAIESTIASDGKQVANRNAKWKPVKSNFKGTTMVKVPAGKFTMGSNDYHDEKPISTQTFTRPFWIDETEVTRGAYKRCVLVGVCTSTPKNTYSTKPNHPINRVTWYQAATYCK